MIKKLIISIFVFSVITKTSQAVELDNTSKCDVVVTIFDRIRIENTSKTRQDVRDVADFITNYMEELDQSYIKNNKLSILKNLNDEDYKDLVVDVVGQCRKNKNASIVDMAKDIYETIRSLEDKLNPSTEI